MKRWIASFAVITSTAVMAPVFAADETAAPVTGSSAADASLELTIIDAGASSIAASGEVYHLKNLSDFDGNYVQLSAGVTVAGGADAIYLQNQHGVVIKMTANAIGLRFNLAAGGVSLALKS